jgi:copper homeostasis protein
MILEVCIDSVESAIAAQEGGAQRVELCADLARGGTTPSAGMIQSVREAIAIALHTMIRPRPGDFCYSDHEFGIMVRDIEVSRKLGADGVVFGILTPSRTVDTERTGALVNVARPLSVTFHRAVDECPDIYRAFDDLARLGVDRVLTSGGKTDVLAGVEVLKDLVKRRHATPRVLAGGGISLDNIREVVTKSGVREVHALSALSSAVKIEGLFASKDSEKRVVDVAKVRAMVDLLHELSSR